MEQMRRKGFTLIELLVVIGILILLVGIAAFGLSKVINSGKRAQTRIALENLRSMMTEYEMVSKGLGRQPAYMWFANTATPTGTPIDIWRDANPNVAAQQALQSTLHTVAVEANDGGALAQLPRYTHDSVANTQLVMQLLLQAPNNKKNQAQLPASQLMERIPPGITLVAASPPKPIVDLSSRAMNPPLILDGWGNPMIFVPAAGLYDVVVSGGDVWHRIVPTTPTSLDGPVKSPDGRPFWVSAGPDGVLGFVDVNNNNTFEKGIDIPAGDDNMYSFEN